jgi:hypothetical protein
MDGASAALSHPATEFGSNQLQVVTQHPKEWGVGVDLYLSGGSIDLKSELGHGLK